MDEHADTRATSPGISIRSRQPAARRTDVVIPEVRTFEFIDSEDKDGTRRAKSHAVKEFKRRQKAAGQRYQRLKDSKTRKIIAPNLPTDVRNSGPLAEQQAGRAMVVASPPLTVPVGSSIDPFDSFPAKLNSRRDLGLVHHHYHVFVPKIFEIAKLDYSYLRKLMFDVVVQDPAAFLLLVSGSAEDIAVRSKKAVSQQTIVYRAKALSIISDRMKTPEEFTSDGSISAYVLLAGLEILHGTIDSYATHMDGLVSVIRTRGGYQVIQKRNPLLAALIAWFDFGASASLIGKRRFEFTSCDATSSLPSPRPLRFTPPLNVSVKQIPKNYTLFEDLMIILHGLELATSLAVRSDCGSEELEKHAAFLKKIDGDLLRTLSILVRPGNVIRRVFIEDSYRFGALIYLSCISNCVKEGELDHDLLLRHFHFTSIDGTSDWGQAIEMIMRVLTSGGKVNSQAMVYHVMQLMDFSVTMDWNAWKSVRDALLDYLVRAEICAGVHQDTWSCRMNIAGV